MRRRLLALVSTLLLLASLATPVAAQTSDVVRIDLVPDSGTEFRFGDRTYGGSISVTWHRDGLAVVVGTVLIGINHGDAIRVPVLEGI